MLNDKKQVKRNLYFNIFSLLANVIVGVLYTPYLVKSLGIVAYGIVPLALIINQYVSVLTGSLTSALTRFYTVSIQRKEYTKASKFLTTSFVMIFCLIIFLCALLFLLIRDVDNVFNIPVNLLESSKLLFLFTICSFFISLLSSVFNITLYAANRLDYLNVIKIIRTSFKLLLVFCLFELYDHSIAYVGLANLLTEAIILIYSSCLFFKYSESSVKLNYKLFDIQSLRVLFVMSIWVIVQQLGDTMIYRIDNVFINKYWSSKESGIIGAFTELGTYTLIIAGVISSLFGPLILQAYSRNEHSVVQQMTIDRSLSVGVLLAVIVGMLCGFSPIILKIWLGEGFVQYYWWLYLKLFTIPFFAAAGVFAFAARAWNRVKMPAIYTIGIGCLNLTLVWLIVKYYNFGQITIIYILFICLIAGIVQSYFLNGLVFSSLYNGTKKIILINFVKILSVLIMVSIIGFLLTPLFQNFNPLVSLPILAVTGLLLLVLSFKVFLTKDQLNAMIALVYYK